MMCSSVGVEYPICLYARQGYHTAIANYHGTVQQAQNFMREARSVGAHGTQMTSPRGDPAGATRGLWEWDGRAPHLANFVYEVYAVSFAEQGGALHGHILQVQADYVAHVLKVLSVSITTR